MTRQTLSTKLVGIQAARRSAVALAMSSLLLLAFAAPTFAQTQRGLVNVNVEDVTVQLPIAIAANVCDLNVNVLAKQVRAGDTDCEADAASAATFQPGNGNGNGGGANQNGLINVNVNDVLVQLPIGIAANLCDINANVLAEQLALGDTDCDATANSEAGA